MCNTSSSCECICVQNEWMNEHNNIFDDSLYEWNEIKWNKYLYLPITEWHKIENPNWLLNGNLIFNKSEEHKMCVSKWVSIHTDTRCWENTGKSTIELNGLDWNVEWDGGITEWMSSA